MLCIFLASVPSFWAENQNAIFSAVLRGQVDFNGAKDLVKNINPKERLMAFQVLTTVLTVYVAPAAAGSGIPEVKAFLNSVDAPNIFCFKTLVVKVE
ncbi:Calcium-dependent protein kinase 17 [Hordeum vulgare]|nr:Calcium-dependent protein kinase 17 [Hordeum vulgare]